MMRKSRCKEVVYWELTLCEGLCWRCCNRRHSSLWVAILGLQMSKENENICDLGGYLLKSFYAPSRYAKTLMC